MKSNEAGNSDRQADKSPPDLSADFNAPGAKPKRHKWLAAIGIAAALAVGVLLISPASPIQFHLNANMTLQDEEIPAAEQKSVRVMNDRLLQCIRDKNVSQVLDLFVDEMRSDPTARTGTARLCEVLQPILQKDPLKGSQFLVRSVGTGGSATVNIGDQYTATLPTSGEDLYLYLSKASDDFQELLLSQVYVKRSGKWKLFKLHAGQARVAGKTADKWLTEAKAKRRAGFDVPALLRLQTAVELTTPAPFIVHQLKAQIDVEIRDLQQQVLRKYKFPIRISEIPSAAIHAIRPQFLKSELIPLVFYVTTKALNDQQQLQAEVEQMAPQLEGEFPGLTKDVSHVAFRAFSEPPIDPQHQYEFYGLTVEISH
jgi:hypothetical protein